jgi:hypothetical protein
MTGVTDTSLHPSDTLSDQGCQASEPYRMGLTLIPDTLTTL